MNQHELHIFKGKKRLTIAAAPFLWNIRVSLTEPDL
jgi:hypothetical protein